MSRYRFCIALILLGFVARPLATMGQGPRGDVLLDVGVARSLAAGEGFAAGFERGTALVRGDAAPGPQDRADQHPPLWPLVGAALSWLAGSSFGGLQLGSLLFGWLLLLLVWRVTDRLVEGLNGAPDGLPALATALAGVSFLLVEYSADGALYGAQACGVLLLVETLAAPRPSLLRIGAVCGALLLLNHQNLVLLPLPLLVLWCGAAPGVPGGFGRGRVLGVAAGALGVAALCQLPWWWRNASVFGDPLHSVNGLYFLYHAGIEPVFAIEGGAPVMRFLDALTSGHVVAAFKTYLPPNLLYVFTTGLVVWPGLLGVVAAGALPLALRAFADRDRRLLALLGAAALLLAVSVLWPATKLRYLVSLTPLVIVLGVRLLAARPLRGERLGAVLLSLVWVGLVWLTRGDVLLTEELPRPERWHVLTWGGALLFVLPLWLRGAASLSPGARLVLCSGLLVVPLPFLAVGAFPPGTAYHSTRFAPDFFGKHAELEEAEQVANLEVLREFALRAGSQGLIGPLGLVSAPAPRLTSLPRGMGSDFGTEALGALLDRGAADHVVAPARQVAWMILREAGASPDDDSVDELLAGGQPGGASLASGSVWLDGRLQVLAVLVREPPPGDADAEQSRGDETPDRVAAEGRRGLVLARVLR